MSPPGTALWLALRRNEAGLRFRKQKAAGEYVLDFSCARAKLAIEVDGEAHERGDRPKRDAVRDAWFATRGVRTIRYAAGEVLGNLDRVMLQIIEIAIARHLRPPPPSPSAPPPAGGGGSR